MTSSSGSMPQRSRGGQLRRSQERKLTGSPTLLRKLLERNATLAREAGLREYLVRRDSDHAPRVTVPLARVFPPAFDGDQAHPTIRQRPSSLTIGTETVLQHSVIERSGSDRYMATPWRECARLVRTCLFVDAPSKPRESGGGPVSRLLVASVVCGVLASLIPVASASAIPDRHLCPAEDAVVARLSASRNVGCATARHYAGVIINRAARIYPRRLPARFPLTINVVTDASPRRFSCRIRYRTIISEGHPAYRVRFLCLNTGGDSFAATFDMA